MRILAIGDFHGRFPKKFGKLIKKEKIDLVVSNGDYPPFHYRKLWFKHCYGKDTELWEVIGKKKYKKLIMEDMKKGENALKALNRLSVPVFTVLGNIDYPLPDDVADFSKKKEKSMPGWDKKTLFADRLKKYKNIKRFDYSWIKFKEYIFIGMRGHSSPGKVKSKAYKRYKAKLDKFFKKFRKENKEGRVIFVSHIVPHQTKLDKIGMKAHKKAKGRHYGSKLARRIISKYQPILFLGGHIHERMGKDKLGKTLLVNSGAAHEGKAAVIELNNGKIKNIKFIK